MAMRIDTARAIVENPDKKQPDHKLRQAHASLTRSITRVRHVNTRRDGILLATLNKRMEKKE